MNLNKKQSKGIISAVLFFIMIWSILVFFGFTTPLPLPEEEGIMIDFGHTETGMGIEEPTQNKPIETPITPEEKESNITQDYEASAVTVPEKKKVEKKKIKKPKKEPIKEERKVDEEALFSSNNDNNNTTHSQSEGDAGGTGNQGAENGDPNTNAYNGTGSGNSGVGYSLRGRKAKGLPKPTYTSNEQGTVVLDIVVNQDGKVISATLHVKGTTTVDTDLLNAAKKAAFNTRFDKKSSAPSKQKGTITYRFVRTS